ncbi:integrase [Catenulispora sp. GAS73]|uniref:hypothetical protein n=1 Tax=Catenulispora sp. GAS73 TaxID=3156269 RepID=UPI003511D20E
MRNDLPSSVVVWTPEQTATFLKRAARLEFYALFLLLAFTGMRRGEAVGLCWTDLDAEARTAQILRQVVQIGWATQVEATPGLRPGLCEMATWLTKFPAWGRCARTEQLANPLVAEPAPITTASLFCADAR